MRCDPKGLISRAAWRLRDGSTSRLTVCVFGARVDLRKSFEKRRHRSRWHEARACERRVVPLGQLKSQSSEGAVLVRYGRLSLCRSTGKRTPRFGNDVTRLSHVDHERACAAFERPEACQKSTAFATAFRDGDFASRAHSYCETSS